MPMMQRLALILAMTLALVNGFQPHRSWAIASRSVHGRVAPRVAPTAAVSVSAEKPLGLILEENEPDSASGVYVSMMDPQGSAAASGQIAKGMVLVSAAGVDCKALTFDAVMNTLIAAPSPVSLVFEEAVVPVAVAEAAAAASEEFTVMASDGVGGKFTTVQVPRGTNLRTALVGGGADLYKTLWDKGMNCAGVGQCGTCIVEIEEGGAVSPRTAVEDKKLKGYGANVRLACQTNVEGQLVVTTQAK